MNSSLSLLARVATKKIFFPACLVSGGQTGADRAALDFAIAQNLRHAGYCPAGRRAENGPIPARYNLAETKTTGYPERTRKNVQLGDATVIFSSRSLAALRRIQRGSGSALTVRECERQGKPFVVLAHFPDQAADAAELKDFLHAHSPRVLNVAGHAESKTPGIHAHVLAVLASVAADLPRAADLAASPS